MYVCVLERLNNSRQKLLLLCVIDLEKNGAFYYIYFISIIVVQQMNATQNLIFLQTVQVI